MENSIKVFVYPNSKDWEEVKKAALATIHKKTIGNNEISSKWKEAMIIGRHSPIREFHIKIVIENIPRWIADQLARHNVGVNTYMGTMRPDRGNIAREEQRMTDTTIFQQTYNMDSFLTMCNARLCNGMVSTETRQLVERMVKILAKKEPEIAKYCVPPCIMQYACKEQPLMELMHKPKCMHFDSFLKKAKETYTKDLPARYQRYQEWRWKN